MLKRFLLPLLAVTAFAVAGCDLFVKVTPENAKGVIHVYTSPRCTACRVAKPIIRKLKKQGFKIREINVLRNPTKAGKVGVHMVPTFIHYHNGKETKRIVGTASENELKRMFRP
ncbi:MAG: thioredoxin family protein [Planctomycetaceae bacterium]